MVKDVLKVGDVLYRVDPKKLSMKVFVVSGSEEVYNYTTTDYENFYVKCNKKRFQIPLDEFPCEFRGLWYFLTEEEANNFVKTQIGM